ncbi:MAG: acetate--CoA ligase family protein [Patescibacteria group bacterium]|nr:acetate--CoA ligase family protein [Patescibacteria group bacterium]
MKKFFEPRSIAIVGASNKKNKVGNILMKNLSAQKKARLFPVNPAHSKIMGFDAFSSVLDINHEVDLAVIAVPAKFVFQVVQECAWRAQPIKHIIIISAGFSEVGSEGRKREEEIEVFASEQGIKIMGPNCLGLINADIDLNATFAKSNLEKGSISLIMQSGALTTALLDVARKKHIGFSKIATLGNKSIVNESDLIDYYAEDKSTKIIALYLEDIADGKRFREAVSRVSGKKPIVIIKAGSSERAQIAIQSHTGAMAGEADIIKEVIRESGGIHCDNLLDFTGVLKLLIGFKSPLNNKIILVTNAGGPGVMTTDLIDETSLMLYDLEESKKRKLKKVLPAESSVENPIDVLGDAEDDRYEAVFSVIGNSRGIGSILSIVTPQAQTPIEKIASTIADANKKFPVPVVPVFIGGEAADIAKEALSENQLYNFSFPFEAIRALEKYQQSAKAVKALKEGSTSIAVNRKRMSWTAKKFGGVTSKDRKVLFYHEAKEIGTKYGLNILDATYPESMNQIGKAKFDYPVVAKIDSPKILHKFDKEGVVLGIKNAGDLDDARKALMKRFGEGKILVQPQIDPGFELIMGIKKDPSFGHVLMIGLGGIFTEAFNKKLLWMLPTQRKKIDKKLRDSVFGKILTKQRININLVIGEASKVAQIAVENPRIKELDINPIMLYSDKEPMIVDFKIILE